MSRCSFDACSARCPPAAGAAGAISARRHPLADGPANLPPDPVAGLLDIPLPQEVSLWPQTFEARLAAVVLLMALVAGVWSFLKYRRVNRYRREALSELD